MEGPLLPTEWAMIFVFIAGVVLWGMRMHKSAQTMEGAFLADRKVPGVIASISTVATNLNANDFLGLTGAVYAVGIIMAHIIFNNSLVLVVVALLLMHRLRRYNVYSLGGWLETRYSSIVGNAYSIVWTFVWMLFNLGLYIYGGALVLETLLGWNLYASIVLLSLVAAFYTLMGGLGAVVATDVLQIALMFFPLVFVGFSGLHEVGGLAGLAEKLPETHKHLWPAQTPFGTLPILLFGMLFMGLSYWSCEAQVVQRPLSARNPEEASIGYMGAAVWYAIIVPFVIVIPGLAAVVLFPDLPKNDHAMPTLVKTFLPPGLYGVAVVGLIAGFLSSADSQINAFCTMFTTDIYRKLIRPNRSDSHYVRVGRIAGVVFTLAAILTALIVSLNSEGMFLFAVSVLATIMPPFGAISLLGVLWRGTTTAGALAGLIAGGVSALGLVVASITGELAEFASAYGLTDIITSDNLYFRTCLSFSITAVVTVAVSLVTPVKKQVDPEPETEDRVWGASPRSLRYGIVMLAITGCVYLFWSRYFG